MKGKISKLLMVLAVCLMAFPCLTYAASPATPAPASHSSDKVAVIPPASNGDLYDNPRINSKAEFDTYDFSTPSQNSNDIRVWFDNQGSETVTVAFYKASDDSKIGSFDVASGKNASSDYSADADTSYYIKVTSQYGADVHGYLRAKQLDAINAISSSEPGIFVPQNTIFVPQNTGGATGKSCGDFVATVLMFLLQY